MGLHSDTFTAGSLSAFPCIILAGENGTLCPGLMGYHNHHQTTLQFIRHFHSCVFISSFLSLYCFLNVFIFSTHASLCPLSLCIVWPRMRKTAIPLWKDGIFLEWHHVGRVREADSQTFHQRWELTVELRWTICRTAVCVRELDVVVHKCLFVPQ